MTITYYYWRDIDWWLHDEMMASIDIRIDRETNHDLADAARMLGVELPKHFSYMKPFGSDIDQGDDGNVSVQADVTGKLTASADGGTASDVSTSSETEARGTESPGSSDSGNGNDDADGTVPSWRWQSAP